MTGPVYAGDLVTLWHGDCVEVMSGLPDCSVDAVVTDPPYGIGFMGKPWDATFIDETIQKRRAFVETFDDRGPNGGYRSAAAQAGRYVRTTSANQEFQAWVELWAAECLRVLKPGGHLLASGSSRTGHRLAAGIEDAGFEIRDSIAWLYGSGFPKSLDVSKAIDKAAGHVGGVAGTEVVDKGMQGGKMHAGRPRVRAERVVRELSPEAAAWSGWGTALKPAFEPIVVGRKPLIGTVVANVQEHGTGALNIDACRIDTIGRPGISGDGNGQSVGIYGDGLHGSRHLGTTDLGRWPANVILDESQAEALDAQSGTLNSGANPARRNADKFRDTYGDFTGQAECEPARGSDSGGASRFFYVAKADSSERPRVDGVAHPTVKPLALMRWLVRLVTPPHGVVLEPFAGSGTTAEACIAEGFRCIAIEREDTYIPLILQRISTPTEAVLL